MSPGPTLSCANASIALGAFTDPLLVDPDPALLSDVIDAYCEAAPALVDPDIDELRSAAAGDGDPLTPPRDLPTLTVLADDPIVDAATNRFRPASRLAALVESGCCRLRTGIEPQPAAVLAGRETGYVLVDPGASWGRGGATGDGGNDDSGDGSDSKGDDDADGGDETVGSTVRLGSDPTLRGRYAALVDTSEERRLRTPSRHRAFGALRERCDETVAAAAVRALDVDPDPSDDAVADARTRAYAVGVRHGALDHALRRACEDAGLGSRATFTRIKRELREAGLLETEPVPQPVGRPRERLVARGALADAEGSEAVVAALQKELG